MNKMNNEMKEVFNRIWDSIEKTPNTITQRIEIGNERVFITKDFKGKQIAIRGPAKYFQKKFKEDSNN